MLGRLGGETVAVVANQPTFLAGSIDRDAADKAARFLQLADAFHVPVIFLADNPGILSGSKAERAGTLRAAARMFMAQSRLRVPKLHVTLRKAYGFGSSIMAMNPFDGQTLYARLPRHLARRACRLPAAPRPPGWTPKARRRMAGGAIERRVERGRHAGL